MVGDRFYRWCLKWSALLEIKKAENSLKKIRKSINSNNSIYVSGISSKIRELDLTPDTYKDLPTVAASVDDVISNMAAMAALLDSLIGWSSNARMELRKLMSGKDEDPDAATLYSLSIREKYVAGLADASRIQDNVPRMGGGDPYLELFADQLD